MVHFMPMSTSELLLQESNHNDDASAVNGEYIYTKHLLNFDKCILPCDSKVVLGRVIPPLHDKTPMARGAEIPPRSGFCEVCM